MTKLKIAVLYGGQSGEHDVSVMSASSVMEELDGDKYDVTPVFIDRAGKWSVPVEDLRTFDAVFPVLHGPMGEDGTVQGLLALMGVPFVGAGVVGSAVGMDKAVFKDVMKARGLPVSKYLVVRKHAWEGKLVEIADVTNAPSGASPELVEGSRPNAGADAPARANLSKIDIEMNVITELGFPCFIKPANMGSSVGITKAKSIDQLHEGMAEAFKWDRKAIIEQAVPNARELEVSVLGNDDLQASVVGEIVPSREFYDYTAKYLDKGDDASALHIPARIPQALSQLVRETAVEVTEACDIRGMARVDFLMDGKTGDIFVNEINTIPGFTEISMYPKLWLASGMTYGGLLDRLIELAREKKV